MNPSAEARYVGAWLRWVGWILTGLAIAVAVWFVATSWSDTLDAFFTTLRAKIQAAGPYGPAMAMVAIALGVIVAPLPDQLVTVAVGYAWGFWEGLAVTIVGGMIGAVAAMLLSRTVARPLAERIVPERLRAEVNRRGHSSSLTVWALLFAAPIGDTLFYAVGLTSVPLQKLTLAALLGRLPQWIVLAAFGRYLQPIVSLFAGWFGG
ncbi:MAG: VTT domain-containing protein [Dehalococcoidia bacterium]